MENDIDAIFKMGVKVMAGNLLQHSDKIRHDPDEIAAVAIRLAQEAREKTGRRAASTR